MASARLSRLQRRILARLAAEDQRTRGTMAADHQDLVRALVARGHDKGNLSTSLHNLEAKGLVQITRTSGGKAEAVDLTAEGRQQVAQLAGSGDEGGYALPTALYHELNWQLFGGRLPRYRVTFAQLPASGWHGQCLPSRRLIRLARGLTGDQLRRTLLHEMCHIGAPGHGRRFQAKLARLAAQGETWAQEELEGYQHPQLTWPDLIQQVKDGLSELAYQQPRPSLAAIWRLAADILVCRPGEVRRKVPWLQAAWRHACTRADQRQALRAQLAEARTRGNP